MVSSSNFVTSPDGSTLTAREAIAAAKGAIEDLFDGEDISNLGLEEVEYQPLAGEWLVTLGFSRPWNRISDAFTLISGKQQTARTLKIVRIRDRDRSIVSINNKD